MDDIISTTYAIPLEVGFGDVRECQIDKDTTCTDVLTALLGRPNDRANGTWAILETVYQRGVLNNMLGEDWKRMNKSKKRPKNCVIKKPQLVIKELRLLEPGQPMHELLKDVCPEPSAATSSILSVINAACETVVFFNPYFRMQTGLPLSHISLFPDPDMTVRQCNRLIREKLGLFVDDDRFALYGFYGKHVARLEERCMVSELKSTWEGQANGDTAKIGFFQFQAVPERADHELLGIERASWLYVKRESGLFQSTKKLYCVLKGTTLFIYKTQRADQDSRVFAIKNIDNCRVFNLGSNVLRTRTYFQITEAARAENHQRTVDWILSSPYPTRVAKWLRVLSRCRRTFESQIPVTYADPDGEGWLRGGRVNCERRQPFSKHRYSDRHNIDPNEVPAGEMTGEQRSRFDDIDALLRAAEMSAEVVKKAGCDQSPDLSLDWMDKIRTFALETTALRRPGFAAKMLPLVKNLLKAAHKFAPALSGSLRAAEFSIEQVDALSEVCKEMCFVYKQHILDLTSFPASPTRHELEYGPQMIGMRMILEEERFFEHKGPEGENEQVQKDDDDQATIGGQSQDSDTVADNNVDENMESIGDNPAEMQERSKSVEAVGPVEETEQPEELDNEPIGEKPNKKGSLVKKMRNLLISERPSQKNNNQNPQMLIEVDPESPSHQSPVTKSPPRQSPTNSPALSPSLPIGSSPQSQVQDDDDNVSVASSKSSFSQKAKAMWARVSSPLSRPSSRKSEFNELKATASFPYAPRRSNSRPFVPNQYTPGDMRSMPMMPPQMPSQMMMPQYPMMMPCMPYPMMMMPQQYPPQPQPESMWSQFMNMVTPQPAPNTQSQSMMPVMACKGCGQEFGDDGEEIIRASGSSYHAACFCCSECKTRLKKASFRHDHAGRLHCMSDCSNEDDQGPEVRDKNGILKTLNTIDVPRRLRKLEANIE